MAKKLFAAFLLVCASLLAFGALTVSAETYGDLTYTVENGEIAITECASGAVSVEIPAQIEGKPVTTIKQGAFFSCQKLTTVKIPDTVTRIGNMAFGTCYSLTRVDITSLAAWCGITFEGKDSNPLSQRISNPFTGSSKTVILYLNGEAVEGNLIIPEGVTAIKSTAFCYCDGITGVSIPKSVKVIGKDAFSRKFINRVDIASIADWCEIDFESDSSNPLGINGTLYINGEPVAQAVIPEGITEIKDYAFCSAKNLKEIYLPESVERIGKSAFNGCDSLTATHISDLSAWCRIDFGDEYSNPLLYSKSLYLNGNRIRNLTVPSDITEIKKLAFYGCTDLQSATLPEGITSIGDYAFSGCKYLKDINLSNRVISIGNHAFSGCKYLKSINLPDCVTGIGDYAFFGCEYLHNVSLPIGIANIGTGAFNGCQTLTVLYIGDSVTGIPQGAFYGCGALKYIRLPQNLLYIEGGAFNGCVSLEKVFYGGGKTQWNNIPKNSGNDVLSSAEIVCDVPVKTYHFETNCAVKLEDAACSVLLKAPKIENEGKVLWWYDNPSFSGYPVEFPYCGEAATLYALWVDGTGESFETAIELEADKPFVMSDPIRGEHIYFVFAPEKTGTYKFRTTGKADTMGAIYNANRKKLTYTGEDDTDNISHSIELTAGEIYYITVYCFELEPFTLRVTEDGEKYRISQVKLKDTEGNEITAVPNTDFRLSFQFEDLKLNQNAIVLLASYTEKGAFRGFTYAETKEMSDSYSYLYVPLEFYVSNPKGDIAKFKIFCWSSLDFMIPIGNETVYPSR